MARHPYAAAPARKAHPGILVEDLDGLAARLRANGIQVRPDANLPGYRRLYLDDCFGNRLELLSPADGGWRTVEH